MNDNIVQNQKDNKKLITIIAAIAIVFAILLIVIIKSVGGDSKKIRAGLNDGFKFLEELKFDDAIAAYEKVLELDPQNVDAYLGIAKGYVGLGNEAFSAGDTEMALAFYDMARTILETGISNTSDKDGLLRDYLNSYVMVVLDYDYSSQQTESDEIEMPQVDNNTAGNYEEELGKLQMIAKEGVTDNMFGEQDITFWGYHLHDLDVTGWVDATLAGGYTEYVSDNSTSDKIWVTLTHEGNGYYEPNFTVATLGESGPRAWLQASLGRRSATKIKYHYTAEFLDLNNTMTIKDVITAIGFTNADDIIGYLREADPDDELSRTRNVTYKDKYGERVEVDFVSSYGVNENGKYSYISSSSYDFEMKFENGASIQFRFSSTAIEPELRLSDISCVTTER